MPGALSDADSAIQGLVETGVESGAAGQAETALLESATASLAQARVRRSHGRRHSWMDCVTHCESVGRSLGSWCALVERTPPASRVGARWAVERQKIAEFKRQAFEASMLYQHAAGFYLGWMRLLEEISGARYSPAGPSFEVAPGQTVSIEG